MQEYKEAYISEFKKGNPIAKERLLAKEPRLKDWYSKIVEGQLINELLTQNQTYTEIVFHAPGVLHLRGQGKSEIFSYLIEADDYQLLFDFFCHSHHINNNTQNPFCSLYLKIGNHQYRVSLLNASINAAKNPKIFFRKIETGTPLYEQFNMDKDKQKFIKSEMKAQKNFIISGATHSGKTTLLRKMIEEIPSHEHLVIIEDTHEIVTDNPMHTHLLSVHEESYKKFCKHSLRMTPDRILFGELRGAEALDILLALNSGQKGFLTTLHATDAVNTIHRLCQLVQIFHPNLQQGYDSLLRLFTQNIDYVIHMEALKVKEVIRVIGNDGSQCLYEKLFGENNQRQELTSFFGS